MKEFDKWVPFFRVVKLNPKMEVRDTIIAEQMKEGQFDVCITTYEGILICQSALKKFKWQYMVVDEAHKLKNKDSKISIVSRQMSTRNRLLLTGTPLQNNLLELWALLNFMMPSIFSSEEDFKQWFDFGEEGKTQQEADPDQNNKNLEIIEGLHKILRPFLLRRTKADLATKLPDKIEMIVNTNMSPMQFDIYEKLLKSQNIFSEKNKSNARQLNNLLMQVSFYAILIR
jgi:SNF2 family DNA or RNA helicase